MSQIIEVVGPDGTIVEFPSDTPRDVMTRVMRQRFGSQQPKTPIESSSVRAPEEFPPGIAGAGPMRLPRDFSIPVEAAPVAGFEPVQETEPILPAETSISSFVKGKPQEITEYNPTLLQRLSSLFPSNRDRASNEYVARQIARKQGIPVEQVYTEAGGARPIFNPEGRPPVTAAVEAAGVIAEEVPKIPAGVATAALRAYRAGEIPVADESWVDRAITAMNPERQGKPDPNYQAFQGLGPSIGFSLANLVASVVAGSAATTVTGGNPVAGVAAGMAASGTVSYRASKDEFLERVKKKLDKESKILYGKPLGADDWEAAKEEFDSAATQYGLWEAIPEAVSNAIFLKAFAGPAKGMSQSMLESVGKKAGALAAEQATETITALGQNAVERKAGLTQQELSVVDAFRQQFVQTLLTTGFMAGGMKGKELATDFYRTYVEPRVDPASALGRAIQADIDAVAFSPEAIQREAAFLMATGARPQGLADLARAVAVPPVRPGDEQEEIQGRREPSIAENLPQAPTAPEPTLPEEGPVVLRPTRRGEDYVPIDDIVPTEEPSALRPTQRGPAYVPAEETPLAEESTALKRTQRGPQFVPVEDTQEPTALRQTKRGPGFVSADDTIEPPGAPAVVTPTPAAAAVPVEPTVPTFVKAKETEPEPPDLETKGLATVEVPLNQLSLSKEVPQFKLGATAKGVVEPLGGKFERTGVAPIQVWRRLDGSLEVISGRHRFDLAQRSGEKTIPAQVHDEAQGFTRDHAAVLDAELNIRDGQGKAKDYVNYFKASGIDRETAESRGLLARATGKRAYTIATQGSDELLTALRSDQISEEAAFYVALNAPNDSRLQAVGINALNDGKTMNAAINLMQAVKALAVEQDTTVDMFGFDDSGMREASEMAKIAARKQRELQARLSAITGAAKNPELAKAEGIDVKDPVAVKQRIEELRQQKAAWDNWSTNPDLIAEVRAERGTAAPQKASDFELTGESEADIKAREKAEKEGKLDAEKKRQADLARDMFTLEGETAPVETKAPEQGDIFAEAPAPAPKVDTPQERILGMTKAEYRKDQSTRGQSNSAAMDVKPAGMTPKTLLDKHGEKSVRLLARLYDVEVKDKNAMAQKLIDLFNNMATMDRYTPSQLESMTLAQLKPLATEMGTSTNGSKAEIIRRLMAFAPDARRKFEDRLQDMKHKAAITNAIRQGKEVSDDVLKDYPDLVLYTRERGSDMYNKAARDMAMKMMSDVRGMDMPAEAENLRKLLPDIEDPLERQVTEDLADAIDALHKKMFGDDTTPPAEPNTGLDATLPAGITDPRIGLKSGMSMRDAIQAIANNPMARLNGNSLSWPAETPGSNYSITLKTPEETELAKQLLETQKPAPLGKDWWEQEGEQPSEPTTTPTPSVKIGDRVIYNKPPSRIFGEDTAQQIPVIVDFVYSNGYAAVHRVDNRVAEVVPITDLVPAPEPNTGDVVQTIPLPNNMETRVFKTSDGYGTGLFDNDSGNFVDGSITRFKGDDAQERAKNKAEEVAKEATPQEAAEPEAPALAPIVQRFVEKVMEFGKTSESFEDADGAQIRTITSKWQGQVSRENFDYLIQQAVSSPQKQGFRYSIILADTPDKSSILTFTTPGYTPTQRRVQLSMQIQTSEKMPAEPATPQEATEPVDPIARAWSDLKTADMPEFNELSSDAQATVQSLVEQGQLTPNVAREIAEDDEINRASPLKETIKAEVGVNKGRVAELLSQQLYGVTAEMPQVTLKELFQNAFDATKEAIEKGQVQQGNISVVFDESDRSIEVIDNGMGMPASVMGKEFLEIAGSKKGTTRSSGGFGIAKVQFLYGNKQLEVISLRDGVLSKMVTTGDAVHSALKGLGPAPDIQIIRDPDEIQRAIEKYFPEGHGTSVKVIVPDVYEDTDTRQTVELPFDVWGLPAAPSLRRSPLFTDVNVQTARLFESGNRDKLFDNRWRFDEVEIGSKFPTDSYAPISSVKFPWGSAVLYTSTKPTSTSENFTVLSNGLWQFTEQLGSGPFKPLPRSFYIDIIPSKSAGELGYPFELNRQGFTKAAEKDVNAIKKYLKVLYGQTNFAEDVKNFGTVQYINNNGTVTTPAELKPSIPTSNTPTLPTIKPTDKVEIKDGRMSVNGKALPDISEQEMKDMKIDVDALTIDQGEIDANKILFHNNVENKDTKDSLYKMAVDKFGEERVNKYFYGVGKTFLRLRNALVAVDPTYADMANEGIGISLDTKYLGVNIRVPFKGMFINPAYSKLSDTPAQVAVAMMGTMQHEMAHFKQRNHGGEFASEMQRINTLLDTHPSFDIFALKKYFIAHLKENEDIFNFLKTEFDSGNLRSIGKRFADSSYEQIRDDGDSGAVEGAGRGREGRPRVSEGAGKGVEAARESTEPTGVSGGTEGQRGRGADKAGPRLANVEFRGRGPNVATFFSGARTLEAALGDINTVMAVEYDKRINEFANSAFGTAFIARDVADVNVQEVKDADPVLFHASPVCKNFSAAKTYRGADDADRKSAEAVARIIREVSPPVVTIENVPKYANTALFQSIVKALDDAGYTWDVVIHDAADYGAAQTRNRMLLRAVKDGDLPALPEKVGPSDWYKQIEDLLPDAPRSTIPPVERKRLDDMIKRGQLDPKKPIITMGGSGFKGTWSAANDGGPSPTLKAANEKARVILPNGEVKVVTPRMMARLMGLPDSYPVPDSPTLAKTVLGNGIHGSVTKSLIAPLLIQEAGPVAIQNLQEPSLAEQEGDLVFDSQTIRKEQIKEYAALRRKLGRVPEKVAEGKAGVDLQREATQLLERASELKQAIDETKPRRDTPERFLAKALEEYSAGNISKDVLDVIQAAYSKQPGLLNGLLLRVTALPKGRDAAAEFNPLARIVRLYKGTSGVDNPVSIRHELTHSLEQMMTPEQRKVIIDQWANALKRAMEKYTDPKSQEYFKAIQKFIQNPTQRNLDAAARLLPSYDMYQYINPSEYWAVNAEPLLAAQLGTPWTRFKMAVQRLFEGLKNVLGFDNKSDVYKTFKQVMDGDGRRISKDVLVNHIQQSGADTVLANVEAPQEERERVDQLLNEFNRPKVTGRELEAVKSGLMPSTTAIRSTFREMVDNPSEAVNMIFGPLNRGIARARNFLFFSGAGLEEADAQKYAGQVTTADGQATATLALDNMLHGNGIAVQFIIQGGLQYNSETKRIEAHRARGSMLDLYTNERALKNKLGDERGAMLAQGYFEAKRSRNIQNEMAQLAETLEVQNETLDEQRRELADMQRRNASPQEIGRQQNDIDETIKDIKFTAEQLDNITQINEDKVLMSEEEIEAFLMQEAAYPELKNMMDAWTATNQRLLKMMREVRLISEKRYDRLSSIEDYVPWQRVQDDDVDIHYVGNPRSATNIAKERMFKKGKVERAVDYIPDNMTDNIIRLTQSVLRQYAANQIVNDYATRNEDGLIQTFAKVDRNKGRFDYVSDGRRVVVEIKDPLIAEAIYGRDSADIRAPAAIAAATNFMRRAITIDPFFQMRQVVQDAPTAAIVTGVRNPAALMGSVMTSFVGTVLNTDPVADILRANGIGGFQAITRTPEKAIKQKKGLVNRSVGAATLEIMDHIGDASDFAARIAAYKRTIAETKSDQMPNGDKALAIHRAANVINFNRLGSSRAIRKFVTYVNFANAYLQSIDTLFTALTARGARGRDTKKALGIMAATVVQLTALTLAYSWLVGGDEEYQKLDDGTKVRNFFIPKSITGLENGILIPINTTAAFIFKAFPELTYNMFVSQATKTPMDATRYTKAVSEAAAGAFFGPEPVPTVIRPIVEVIIDRSFFTERPLTPRGMETLEKFQQFTDQTSELGKLLSQTGYLSPIEWDHLIRGTTGIAGMMAQYGSNMIGEYMNVRPESTAQQLPGVGRFIAPKVGRGPEALFYDLQERVRKAATTYKDLEDTGQYEKAEKFDKEKNLLIDLNREMSRTESKLKKINSEIRMLSRGREEGTAKERRKEITELQRDKQELLEGIEQLRKDAGL